MWSYAIRRLGISVIAHGHVCVILFCVFRESSVYLHNKSRFFLDGNAIETRVESTLYKQELN